MNVVVIVFYSIAGAWLLGLAIFTIVKKAKAKKRVKQEMDNIDK